MMTTSAPPVNNRLTKLLEQTGLFSHDQVVELVSAQRVQGISITEEIVERRLVREDDFLKALAGEMNVPYDDLKEDLAPDVLKALPTKSVFQYHVIPMEDNGRTLRVATHDPFKPGLRDGLSLASGGKRIRFALATKENIDKASKKFYGVGGAIIDQILADQEDGIPDLEFMGSDDIDEGTEEASVVKFVNQIIFEAHSRDATDIHIEPMEKDLRIRYREDGVLQQVPVPQELKRLQDQIIARIKVMAHLDIAEKRLPQDGRISVRIKGQEIDIRVSTAPTVYGESVSLRLLMRNVHLLGMNKLGLNAPDEEKLTKLIRKPHGIILVTGPTGSGKSTSLYTYLSTINSNDIRIITTEDPIEYQMEGINQIQMKPDIGLTFASALRSILRQDPDVIMVGEIRDKETAEIAIQAALTGHLVFSTLHTNDSAGAITRLVDMGIEPFLVASSIEAIVAQRLIRRLCPDCKRTAVMSRYDLDEIKFPTHRIGGDLQPMEAVGCETCRQTGYRGRTGIYEVLIIDDSLRPLIINHASASEMKHQGIRNGMHTLREDGWDKVLNGVTSIEEVLRVADLDEEEEEELDEIRKQKGDAPVAQAPVPAPTPAPAPAATPAAPSLGSAPSPVPGQAPSSIFAAPPPTAAPSSSAPSTFDPTEAPTVVPTAAPAQTPRSPQDGIPFPASDPNKPVGIVRPTSSAPRSADGDGKKPWWSNLFGGGNDGSGKPPATP